MEIITKHPIYYSSDGKNFFQKTFSKMKQSKSNKPKKVKTEKVKKVKTEKVKKVKTEKVKSDKNYSSKASTPTEYANTNSHSLGFMRGANTGSSIIDTGKNVLQALFGKKPEQSASVVEIGGEEKKKKLSTGAIIGIAAGGLLLIGTVVFLVTRNQNSKK